MKKEITEGFLSYIYDGERLAYVKYKYLGDYIDIASTFVDPSLRGQGIASSLMEDMERLCIESKTKIKASCSYAKKYFSKGDHPLYIG